MPHDEHHVTLNLPDLHIGRQVTVDGHVFEVRSLDTTSVERLHRPNPDDPTASIGNLYLGLIHAPGRCQTGDDQ